MSAQVDERLLEERLTALESARVWSPRIVSRLESHIRSSDDAGVFRINPLGFAADKGLEEAEAIDLFLHAAALGLFEMNWMLLCPMCSGVVESFQALRGVHQHYFCNVCVVGFEAKLDEFIAVTFTVNPAVRDTKYHHPERLSAREYFFEYCASPDGRMPDGTPFAQVQAAVTRHIATLAPGESQAVAIDVDRGIILGVSHGGVADILYVVDGEPDAGPRTAPMTFRLEQKERETGALAPGEVTVSLTNATPDPGVFLVAVVPLDFADGPPPLTFVPFLSGKRLITNQTFRALFRSEVIQASEGIGVSDITLLFTDLKGSTALYDRIGDLNAFSLVQRHFDKLQTVSVRNNGAIIKTIGDAVMASFMQPADAVCAALEMLEEIGRFNAGQPDKQLVLKIGIHTGAAIAVTLNDRLDYFGQTVNIAARVQDLADADEIFVSGEVFGGAGVDAVLAGASVDAQVAHLKGVHGDLNVFRVRRPPPGGLAEPETAHSAA